MSIKEQTILMCAFRYALGRRTYVVYDVANYILENEKKIQGKLRKLIIKEISEAENLGMEIDKALWLEVLDKLR